MVLSAKDSSVGKSNRLQTSCLRDASNLCVAGSNPVPNTSVKRAVFFGFLRKDNNSAATGNSGRGDPACSITNCPAACGYRASKVVLLDLDFLNTV